VQVDQLVRDACKLKEKDRMTTTVTIPAATLVVAFALGGLLHQLQCAGANIAAKMGYTAPWNCSFSSVQQCKAAISGTYAARLRDPFIKGDSIKTTNHSANTYCFAAFARPSRRNHLASAAPTD